MHMCWSQKNQREINFASTAHRKEKVIFTKGNMNTLVVFEIPC